VKNYQTVSAGTPMLDLVGDGALKVRLNVPSALMVRLKQGSHLDITIPETGKTYPAHVSAVNARVDAVAQTVELEAQLDGEHPDLVAGMSGIARFPASP
jgi:multidrug efflux pump subunit AcrA (membrane-fusion protein)